MNGAEQKIWGQTTDKTMAKSGDVVRNQEVERKQCVKGVLVFVLFDAEQWVEFMKPLGSSGSNPKHVFLATHILNNFLIMLIKITRSTSMVWASTSLRMPEWEYLCVWLSWIHTRMLAFFQRWAVNYSVSIQTQTPLLSDKCSCKAFSDDQ